MKQGVGTDEWTGALTNVLKAWSAESQRLALSRIGAQVVVRIKTYMTNQLGFANGTPYKKLRIRYRYHGHKTLVGGRTTNKTAVTSATKALIDYGDLLKSWNILARSSERIDIGPNTPFDMAKATFNEDRGDWGWGRDSTDFVEKIWVRHFDQKAKF